MRVTVECRRGFTADRDDELPIGRRALMAVAEQVANRLEELELFTARTASLRTAGNRYPASPWLGSSRRALPADP